VLVYFGALLLARIVFGVQEGQSAAVIAASCAWLATLGATAAGLLALLAWLAARATVYSITTGRLILRFGVAVPITINIPYALVQSADLKSFKDGSAELSVGLSAQQRVGWLVTWPHVRPGYFSHPQPCMRGLRNAAEAAAILAKALEAEAGQCAAAPVKNDSKESAEAGRHPRPWHAEAF
jgi:hypothetical protein